MENVSNSVDQPRRRIYRDGRLGGRGRGGVGGVAGSEGRVVGRRASASAAVGAVLEDEAAGLVEALLDDDSLGVELVLYLRQQLLAHVCGVAHGLEEDRTTRN